MSQGSVGPEDSPTPGLSNVLVAKYTINAGKRVTVGGASLPVFQRGSTNTLVGPNLENGDLILNVVTDVTEAFADADAGNNTTIQVRFNDGSTQTDIEAASSIGGAPWSTVSQNQMVQDWATEGDWLKLTLPTRVEAIVSSDVDITAGIMDVYVFFIRLRG